MKQRLVRSLEDHRQWASKLRGAQKNILSVYNSVGLKVPCTHPAQRRIGGALKNVASAISLLDDLSCLDVPHISSTESPYYKQESSI